MIAIRKTAFDGMTESDRSTLTKAVARVQLGEPVQYRGENVVWYVWDDPRLRDGTEWQAAMPKPVEANSRFFDGVPDGWTPVTGGAV